MFINDGNMKIYFFLKETLVSVRQNPKHTMYKCKLQPSQSEVHATQPDKERILWGMLMCPWAVLYMSE